MHARKEIVLELVINQNLYRFSMPEGAPLGEIYDVGFQLLKKVVEYAGNAVVVAEKQAQANQTQMSPEVPVEVVLPEGDTNGNSCI